LVSMDQLAEIKASNLSDETKKRLLTDVLAEKPLIATYGQGNFYHFFFGRIALDNLLSEDYSFSDLAYSAGIQPWINCGIRLNHDGRTVDPQAPMPQNQPSGAMAPKGQPSDAMAPKPIETPAAANPAIQALLEG
jgi:hypothetical protein